MTDKNNKEHEISTPEPVKQQQQRRSKSAAHIAVAAAAVVVLAIVVVIVLPITNRMIAPADKDSNNLLTPNIQGQAAYPGSYDELFNNLKEHIGDPSNDFVAPLLDIAPLSTEDAGDNTSSAPSGDAAGNATGDVTTTVPSNPGSESSNSSKNESDNYSSSNDPNSIESTDFSETNTQVSLVDEGDIVKTDGKYIYILHKNEIIIASAAGEDSKELSRFFAQEDYLDNPNVQLLASDLYIHNNKLAVLYEYYYHDPQMSDKYYYYRSSSSNVAFFDVSDAKAPKLIDSFGQDGTITSSRVYDGVLYLISEYTDYWGEDVKQENPQSYVPRLYGQADKSTSSEDTDVSGLETERLLEPNEICILPDYNFAYYTIVSSMNFDEIKRIDTKSILGQTQTEYMNADNLYIAALGFKTEEEITPKDDQSQYVDVHRFKVSNIAKFALDNGRIDLTASATVDGGLLNQFSLDEYNGYLRLATTTYGESFSRKEDLRTGLEALIYGSDNNTGNAKDAMSPGASSTYVIDESTSALMILDGELNVVGSIEGLAEDERIYSVRFDGPIGYMVTFKQIDPLFTIDLSNPTKPVVMSALKIPGFSQYLHLYNQDRLLGLGTEVSPGANSSSGLKLSMFDTSDPFNVSERNKLVVDFDNYTAIDNHKALLIDSKHDLIGFEVSNGNWRSYDQNKDYRNYYMIYGYSDDRGFYERAALALPDNADYYNVNARGLYIGDFLYVIAGASLGVFDLETLDNIKWIELPVSEVDSPGSIPLYAIE